MKLKKPRLLPFDYVNIVLMLLMMLVMVYPFWYTLVGSLNEGSDYMRGGVWLWPRKFTLYNYQAVFMDKQILQAFWVTFWKVLVGTVTSVLFTAMVSYGITRPKLKLKKIYIPFIMVTLFSRAV
ncbi:MAG: hypothetical protein RR276_04975 [Angelakisella sp.]